MVTTQLWGDSQPSSRTPSVPEKVEGSPPGVTHHPGSLASLAVSHCPWPPPSPSDLTVKLHSPPGPHRKPVPFSGGDTPVVPLAMLLGCLLSHRWELSGALLETWVQVPPGCAPLSLGSLPKEAWGGHPEPRRPGHRLTLRPGHPVSWQLPSCGAGRSVPAAERPPGQGSGDTQVGVGAEWRCWASAGVCPGRGTWAPGTPGLCSWAHTPLKAEIGLGDPGLGGGGAGQQAVELSHSRSPSEFQEVRLWGPSAQDGVLAACRPPGSWALRSTWLRATGSALHRRSCVCACACACAGVHGVSVHESEVGSRESWAPAGPADMPRTR